MNLFFKSDEKEIKLFQMLRLLYEIDCPVDTELIGKYAVKILSKTFFLRFPRYLPPP